MKREKVCPNVKNVTIQKTVLNFLKENGTVNATKKSM
tara:strand:+ start:147 stop:257 length:111 start_codon:yes stop_codon:yes gene_type:complete